MTDYPTITHHRPGRRHRIAATIVSALLLIVTVACFPFSSIPLPAHPAFMPAFAAVILLTDLMTASLLIAQARIGGDRQALRLSAAYMFSCAITVPHLLAFPGLLAPQALIGQGVSAVWLWCAWHGGFPLAIIRFALGSPGQLSRRDWIQTFGGLILAATIITVAATMLVPWLPTLFSSGNFGRLNTLGIGPTIIGATLAAEILVLTRLRCRDAISTWLAVALLAASLDVTLTLLGGGRFTVGWYLARLLSLVTGVTVLFALLSELMREAGRVAEVNTKLEALLRIDALTGLANRRAFETALEQEWRRAHRDQTALSVMMIDIDWFKGFNDCYGHPAGDRCLREVADALASQIQRPADMAARLGGEEFGILLPTTDEDGARRVAERMRACVAGLVVTHPASALGHVTVSIGVATLRPFASLKDGLELVNAADRALYKAKDAGRNAVRTDAPWTRTLAAA